MCATASHGHVVGCSGGYRVDSFDVEKLYPSMSENDTVVSVRICLTDSFFTPGSHVPSGACLSRLSLISFALCYVRKSSVPPSLFQVL